MKRLVLTAAIVLITLGLSLAATLKVGQTPALLLGLGLAGSTTFVVDRAAMRFRKRARRTPAPAPARIEREPLTGQEDEGPSASEPVEEELWSIPRTLQPEAEPRSWLPARPGEEVGKKAPPGTAVSQLVGRDVGPYQILEKIGQGGMATVYKGFHPDLQRHVAIKVLAETLITTPELAERFRREAQTVAALRHPNIVQVFDFGPLDSTHYLAMEYVEGSDLHAEMTRRRERGQGFSQEEILDLLGQVADALDYAHGQGVVHRDVKPGNILLGTAPLAGTLGQPILTDFGLATLRRTRATLITTIGQNVLGTPEYTAPEQALDAQAAGPQSDVYSLGCILYEMVTGRLPFEADSPLSIALMHINEEPTPPRQHVPDLAPGAEAVILQALDKEPEDRSPTARALVDALRRAWEAEVAPEQSETAAAVSPARIVGSNLGPYQVKEKIGQGGMTAVYKAFHPELQRHVAIKVLARNPGDSPKLADRFQREARTVAALRHPHIVQVHDFGSLDSTCYLVMEYVEGTDLRAAIKLHKIAKRPWSPGEILKVLAQIGAALDYAHSRGVVHRDVKPANILISLEGEHFLTDFGISAMRQARTTQASTLGQAFGTPEYVAPEQATDYRTAVPQSDLYSLACIAYEMATGHLPFESDSPLTLALMHISQDPIPPTFYAPDLPPAVEAVMLQMLAKEADRRLPTAQRMVEALRQAWGKEHPI